MTQVRGSVDIMVTVSVSLNLADTFNLCMIKDEFVRQAKNKLKDKLEINDMRMGADAKAVKVEVIL